MPVPPPLYVYAEPTQSSVVWSNDPPSAPEVEFVHANGEQVTIKWEKPDLQGAPLVEYRVYVDNGLGGRTRLFATIPAEKIASTAMYDENGTMEGDNNTVVYSVQPLTAMRHYRIEVSAVSAAAESDRTMLEAETCRVPVAPTIYYLPSATQVMLRWDSLDFPNFPSISIDKPLSQTRGRLFI